MLFWAIFQLFLIFFMITNAQIWVNLKNYSKFRIFADFACILMCLCAKLIFCQFWWNSLVNRLILAKIQQHYEIRIRRSDYISFHEFRVYIYQLNWLLFAFFEPSKSKILYKITKINKKQTNYFISLLGKHVFKFCWISKPFGWRIF